MINIENGKSSTLLGGVIKHCTGCRACEQICPKSAISMVANNEGFLESSINYSRCIDCGLCRLVCPQNKAPELNTPLKVYAVRDIDDKEIRKSASGGAFVVAARNILSKGGIVVGAAYNNDMSVSHIIVNSLDDLQKLQSSKYVQSDTYHTFKKVREGLKKGTLVLYSGTPCQIAGLKGFLRKEYDNLYTMDLICHGVASPKLFSKYLSWLSHKLKCEIIDYNFRDKSIAWGLEYMIKVKHKSKAKARPSSLDPYYYHFLKGDTYRECCYCCKYSQRDRIGDITIGDYWGIEKEHPDFYSSKGVSCLLVNSKKGMRLWNMISKDFAFIESSFEKSAKANHNLKSPTLRPSIRDRIYNHIDEISVDEYFSTQLAVPFNLKARVKTILPKWFKIFIKRYL